MDRAPTTTKDKPAPGPTPATVSTYDRLMASPLGREALTKAAEECGGLTERAMRWAFDFHDLREARFKALGFPELPAAVAVRPIWRDGRVVGREYIEDSPSGTGWAMPADLYGFIDRILRQASNEAERWAAERARPAPSGEAIRKRKARANGRVKPRPPRPARTLAQEVESRRKAVETRRAKVEADWREINNLARVAPAGTDGSVWLAVLIDRHARGRVGLMRAEAALRTFAGRLAGEQAKPDAKP